MSDAVTLPTTEPSTNGAGSRQQRLAAAVKNLRSRPSLGGRITGSLAWIRRLKAMSPNNNMAATK